MGNHRLILLSLSFLVLSAAYLQAQQDISAWKLYTDAAQHVSFKYPDTLGTEYIFAQSWPPTVQVSNGAFNCNQNNPSNNEMQKTEERVINGRTYCVTEESEGAAGTMYTQYTYSFPKNGKVVSLNFTIAYVQCGNYNNPERQECEQERKNFNIDGIIDQIAQTIVLKK
jgi:hypothetical protein